MKSSERQKALKEAGLCYWCEQPVDNGRTYCRTCEQKKNELAKALYRDRRQRGECARCGRISPGGGFYCPECGEKINRKQRERYQRKKALRAK